MRPLLAFILFTILLLPVQAQTAGGLPEQRGIVSDYAEVIGPAARARIIELAERLQKITSVQLRVLVVRALDTPDPRLFSKALYDRWDVGNRAKGLEHGVLLVISLIERQAVIVVGREVGAVLTPKHCEDIEWSVLAQLSRGNFAEGTELGATAISQLLITNWPRRNEPGLKVDWAKASVPLFLLFVFSVALTMLVGGGFLMAFGMIVGGLFGYIFLDIFGLIMGGALGFFLFYGRSEKMEETLLAAGRKAIAEMSEPPQKHGTNN